MGVSNELIKQVQDLQAAHKAQQVRLRSVAVLLI